MCLDESSREIQKFVNKSLLLCLTNKACLTILLKRSRREFNIVYIFYCYKAYFCKLPRSGQICLCPPALGVSSTDNAIYATLSNFLSCLLIFFPLSFYLFFFFFPLLCLIQCHLFFFLLEFSSFSFIRHYFFL